MTCLKSGMASCPGNPYPCGPHPKVHLALGCRLLLYFHYIPIPLKMLLTGVLGPWSARCRPVSLYTGFSGHILLPSGTSDWIPGLVHFTVSGIWTVLSSYQKPGNFSLGDRAGKAFWCPCWKLDLSQRVLLPPGGNRMSLSPRELRNFPLGKRLLGLSHLALSPQPSLLQPLPAHNPAVSST